MRSVPPRALLTAVLSDSATDSQLTLSAQSNTLDDRLLSPPPPPKGSTLDLLDDSDISPLLSLPSCCAGQIRRCRQRIRRCRGTSRRYCRCRRSPHLNLTAL